MKRATSVLLALLFAFCLFAVTAQAKQDASVPEAQRELSVFYKTAAKAFASKDTNPEPPADAILKSMKPYQAKYRLASIRIRKTDTDTAISDDKAHQVTVAYVTVETTYTKPRKSGIKPEKLVVTYNDKWRQDEKQEFAWKLVTRAQSKEKSP